MKKTLLSAAISLAMLSVSPAYSAVQIGDGATTDDEDAIAIGRDATSADFGYAIGNGASAEGESISIGENANSTLSSFALGSNAIASSESIAIGKSASASISSLALGVDSVANDRGIALGYGSSSTGNYAMSLGYQSSSSGQRSISIGRLASATGDRSVAIGDASVADEFATVSFGSATQKRRLTNITDGINANDAATFGQLTTTADSIKATTDSMSVSLNDFQSRLGTLEVAGAGATLEAETGIYASSFGVGAAAVSNGLAVGNYAKALSGNGVAVGTSSTADSFAVALGVGATAEQNAVALGYNSYAEANTISVGSAGNGRRITNVSDGIFASDAVNFGQFKTTTDAMSAQIRSLSSDSNAFSTAFDSRLTDLENSFASYTPPTTPTTPTAPGVDSGYVDDGDSKTLADANANAAAGDASTLASANNHADAGDAATLASANKHADDGDAATLASANTHADKGDAATLATSKDYSDAGDARTLSSAQAYSDLGNAQTYSRATSYADVGDARTLQAANDHADAGDARLNSKIKNLEGKLSSGIAALAAQPSLPAIGLGQKAVAVGTGHYNGKNAVGIVFGYAPRPNLTYGVGVSMATDDSTPVFRTSVTKVW